MNALASRPSGVPSRTAARNTSPVLILGSPARSRALACVPFPAPGGPRSTTIVSPRGLRGGTAPLPAVQPRSIPVNSRRPATPCRREAHAGPLLHEPIVFPQQQVLVHVLNVSSATPTTISSDVPPNRNGTLICSAIQMGKQRDERQEDRARQRDPVTSPRRCTRPSWSPASRPE